MTDKLFETATRKQYRFLGKNGSLSVEDLWVLNLSALDAVYAQIVSEIRKDEDKSDSLLKATKTVENEDLQIKREIVKYIFTVRQEEEVQRKSRAVERQKRAEKRQALEAILKKKEFENFSNLSKEDILKQLKELED